MQLEKRLMAKKINPTAMRLLVLDFLQQQTVAVNIADLESALVRTDRTTLYRTLKTFEENGLIHSVEDGSGATKYALCNEGCEPCRHSDRHLHFSCATCGRTMCIPTVAIPLFQVPLGFVVSDVSMLAKGICDRCTASDASQLL